MQSEVQLIVKVGAISPTVTLTDKYTQAANGQDYFEANVTPPLAAYYPNGSKVEFYNNTTSSVEFTTYVVSTDDGTGRVYINPPFATAPDATEGIDILVYAFVGTNLFLDLYPNESISLSYQFTDLNNFTQIGTFSRDFRIPATKRNVEALGPLYDYNFVDDVLSFSRKYEAELRVDTIPISRGYLRVMAAYKQQDYLSDFQVAFYSQAPNFVKELGDKKFVDLTDLPNLDEQVNYVNVTTVLPERIWSLIDRAENNLAFDEGNYANTRPVQDVGQPLAPTNLTPCLRADYLLTQIFADAGYELDATALNAVISDYYIPWVNQSVLQVDNSYYDFALNAQVNTLYAVPSSSFIATYNTIVADPSSSYNTTTSTYTIPAQGIYNVQAGLNYLRTPPPPPVTSYSTFIILIAERLDFTGTTVLSQTTLIQYPFTYGVNGVPFTLTGSFYGSANIQCNAGDKVRIRVQIPLLSAAVLGTISVGNDNLFITSESFTTATIRYAMNAPDVKQIDFVSDIIKMHNLAVIPDGNIENKLKLEPMQTFIGSGATLDWTKKLDTSKDIVIKGTDDLRKTKLTFTYSAGQDTYSKLFVDQGRVYGDYKAEPYLVTNTQIPSSFQSGETSVKLVAQSTPATQINGTTIIVPRFWTQSGEEPPKFTAPQLRILFWAESPSIYLYDDVSNNSILTSVPTLNHYSDTSGFNPDYNGKDLNFAPETPLHDYTANPFDNLFTLYWRDYLDTIYADDARILEANFALNNTDIISLNFGDLIYVKDAYWRILELSDYKMGQYESTRVKLLKMNPGAPPMPRCDLKPDSVNADGSVNFLNLSGAPVSATETCCLAFNYTWSAGTNLCYARPSDRTNPTRPQTSDPKKGEINGIGTVNSGFNNINTTTYLDAGVSSYSLFAGNLIRNEGFNNNIIAVGDTITLKGDQRGAALFGKSVESVVPGLAIGGGWAQDDRTYAYNGSQSAGTFLMSNQGTYPATLNNLELFIEGIANKRIEMEDEMLWYMRMHVMVQPTINQYINATITAQMGKTGGIAFATAPIVQYQDTSMAGRTVALVIDTATNTAQHRLNIQIAGGAYPFTTRLLAEINYTQFR